MRERNDVIVQNFDHCTSIRMDELELKCTGCLYLNYSHKISMSNHTKGNEEICCYAKTFFWYIPSQILMLPVTYGNC